MCQGLFTLFPHEPEELSAAFDVVIILSITEQTGALEPVSVAASILEGEEDVVVAVGDGHFALALHGDVLEGFVDDADLLLIGGLIRLVAAHLIEQHFGAHDGSLVKGRHELLGAVGFIKNKDRAGALEHFADLRRTVVVQVSSLPSAAEESLRHADGKKKDQTHEHASYEYDPCF